MVNPAASRIGDSETNGTLYSGSSMRVTVYDLLDQGIDLEDDDETIGGDKPEEAE